MADGQGKAFVLLLLVLAAFASAGGYWYLARTIDDGEKRFAAGQRKLVAGSERLQDGKAELRDGKRRLSEGKEDYQEAKRNFFLVWADALFKGGRGFEEAEEEIADGERKIADGEERIDAGENRLDAGKQALRKGDERLRLAEAVRVACAAGAVLFSSLAIVLGWRWRRG